MQTTKLKYTDKIANEVCNRIASGESLELICKDKHIPTSETIRQWKRKYDEFALNYASAREDQGDYYGQKVSTVSNDCLKGEVKPDVARVAMDGYKWTAARMNRATYGDRTVNENRNTNVNIDLDELTDADLIAKIKEGGDK